MPDIILLGMESSTLQTRINKAASFRKQLVSEKFLQVEITGARHDYRGYEKQAAEPVVMWLKGQEGK